MGASLVLLTISILFLRGQIRPILSLAHAAESFGKGQKMPDDFAPRGADEVRRAGLAFMLMRERIERQMEQRTAMLTGVSHDLRTILTRFKLQLALAGKNPDLEPRNATKEDVGRANQKAQSNDPVERQQGRHDLRDIASQANDRSVQKAADQALDQANQNVNAADVKQGGEQAKSGDGEQRRLGRQDLRDQANHAKDPGVRQAAEKTLHQANQVANSDTPGSGKGMAIAGMCCGGFSLLSLLWWWAA